MASYILSQLPIQVPNITTVCSKYQQCNMKSYPCDYPPTKWRRLFFHSCPFKSLILPLFVLKINNSYPCDYPLTWWHHLLFHSCPFKSLILLLFVLNINNAMPQLKRTNLSAIWFLVNDETLDCPLSYSARLQARQGADIKMSFLWNNFWLKCPIKVINFTKSIFGY